MIPLSYIQSDMVWYEIGSGWCAASWLVFHSLFWLLSHPIITLPGFPTGAQKIFHLFPPPILSYEFEASFFIALESESESTPFEEQSTVEGCDTS